MDKLAAHLRAKEEALFSAEVRRSAQKLKALLAEDFVEFGSSGRIWTRDAIIEDLAGEVYAPIKLHDFACAELGPEAALVTYRAVRLAANSAESTASLRSSVWTQKDGQWVLRFHQGTRMS